MMRFIGLFLVLASPLGWAESGKSDKELSMWRSIHSTHNAEGYRPEGIYLSVETIAQGEGLTLQINSTGPIRNPVLFIGSEGYPSLHGKTVELHKQDAEGKRYLSDLLPKFKAEEVPFSVVYRIQDNDEDQFAAIFKFISFNRPTRKVLQNGYGGFEGYSSEVYKKNYLKEIVKAVVMFDGQLVLQSSLRITDVRISTLSGFEKKVLPIEVSQLAQVDEVDLHSYDTYFPTSFEELKKELKDEEYFFVQFRAPGKVEGVMTVVCRVKLGSTPTVDTAEFAELSSKPLDKNGLKAAIENVKHFLPYPAR